MAERKAQVAEIFSGYKAKAFTEVLDISARELKAMLAISDNKVVMVDVRTPEEQDVSIIPNSIRQDVFDPKNYEDHTIVAYCTIGYRSGLFVKKLQDDNDCKGVGVMKALNLRGSILDWSLEGYPLVDEKTGKETKRVHVKTETWNLVGDGYQAEWFSGVAPPVVA